MANRIPPRFRVRALVGPGIGHAQEQNHCHGLLLAVRFDQVGHLRVRDCLRCNCQLVRECENRTPRCRKTIHVAGRQAIRRLAQTGGVQVGQCMGFAIFSSGWPVPRSNGFGREVPGRAGCTTGAGDRVRASPPLCAALTWPGCVPKSAMAPVRQRLVLAIAPTPRHGLTR